MKTYHELTNGTFSDLKYTKFAAMKSKIQSKRRICNYAKKPQPSKFLKFISNFSEEIIWVWAVLWVG